MRKFFQIIFVFIILVVCITISLDLTGIINLPENLSLKKYLLTTIDVMGKGDEVYYPDYDATGLNAENKVAQGTIGTTIKETQGQTTEEDSVVDQEKINEVLSSIKDDNEVIEQNYNVTDNSFFYTQLDTYGKTIYSRLYANLDNLKMGTYSVDFGTTFNDLLHTENGEATLTNAFQLSINALLLDHPEIFYLDVTKMYMFTETTKSFAGTTYKISIGPDSNNSYLLAGFNDARDIYDAEEKIRIILNSITSNLNGSTYEKIVKIHNYLIDNTVYDENSQETTISHTIFGTFVNKLAVCDGYSKAFKYILDNIGISCVEVCGVARNSAGVSESHAWNYVLLDGKWYAVDVTWDDPIIIGGNGVLTNELRYNYFLKGSNDLFVTHQEDGYIVTNGEFRYPIISTESY